MIDILIIGGGVAGMSAALYALRSGKKVLILEKEAFGGQIATSPKVENYPSIKEISGEELASNLFEQITTLGVDFDVDNIHHIKKEEDIFYIEGDFGKYEAKSVIIATGVKHRKINIQDEDELIGNGLSYCAVCDGAFFKNQDVAIIGDANTALQYALMLSNTCSKVYLCMLFDRFFADDILVKRVKERENIEIIKNISLKKFIHDKSLKGLEFVNTQTEESLTINVAGCFIAIGQVPSNEDFKNVVELDKNGYIITNDQMETMTPGLYAIGDCRVKKVRQVTTACSDGAISAIMAVNYLDSKENI